MSGLQQVTFDTIINVVKNYLKTNCVNIANYAGMAAYAKNGYSYTLFSNGGTAGGSIKGTFYTNVVQVAASTVDSEMNSFISTIGLSGKTGTNITDNSLIPFVNDMVVFMSAKMAFLVYNKGNNSNERVLVYLSNNVSGYQTVPVGTGYLAKTLDVKDTITRIIQQATSNIRIANSNYVISFT